jgi:hypothetical protein
MGRGCAEGTISYFDNNSPLSYISIIFYIPIMFPPFLPKGAPWGSLNH